MSDFNCVVGIGCSAGGVEALKRIVAGLQARDVTYIIVQHLSPTHESMMVKILEKMAHLPIKEAVDGEQLRPATIYITPPGKLISVSDNCFKLEKIASITDRVPLHTIDIFFEAMAKNFNENCIGVILSGSGSDGMRGCRAIKEVGGAVIAQEPSSAQFKSMPSNIVNAGLADLEVSLEELSEALNNLVERMSSTYDMSLESSDETLVVKIIELISRQSGIAFTNYKNTTLERRIQKRMVISKTANLEEYFSFLVSNDTEVRTIANEFLIGVTAFFRDSLFFEILNQKVILKLVENVEVNGEIRVWTPACSTGEEAYSIAMLLEDQRQSFGKKFSYRVFGSDIDGNSIAIAQAGTYARSLLHDFPSNFINRYFEDLGNDKFKICRNIKDRVVFSKHDIIADPPFGKMNLVTFRNCSIYLNKATQKNILAILEHSLNIGGYLFLGASETIGSESSMKVIDSSAKIYQKLHNESSLSKNELLKLQNERIKLKDFKKNNGKKIPEKDQIFLDIGHTVLSAYAPPSIILNKDGELLHVFGDISPYTSMAIGSYDGAFYNCLPKEAQNAFSLYIKKFFARLSKENQVKISAPHMRDIKLGNNDYLRLEIRALSPDKFDPVFMIAFRSSRESQETTEKIVDKYSNLDTSQFMALEAELAESQKDLEFSIDNLETLNEELQSSNEELVTSNEELQSTNEELQSVNEELHTMNAEFQDKIEELSQLNRDIDVLLDISKVGTMFLDDNLNIRRVSKKMLETMDLREGDIGRSIAQFNEPLYRDFLSDCRAVLETNQPLDRKIQIDNKNWSLVKIYPYLNYEDINSGLVILTIDVSEIETIRDSQSMLYKLLLSVTQTNFSVDLNGEITLWPQSATAFFGRDEAEMLGQSERLILPLSARSDLEIVYQNANNGLPTYLNNTFRLDVDDNEKEITLIAYGKYDQKGKCIGINYCLYPINEENNNDVMLRNEVNLLRVILESHPMALMVVSEDGTFRYVNTAACELLGVDEETIYARRYNSSIWELEDFKGNKLKDEELPFKIVMKNKEIVHDMECSVFAEKKQDRVKLLVSGSPFQVNSVTQGGVFSFKEVVQ